MIGTSHTILLNPVTKSRACRCRQKSRCWRSILTPPRSLRATRSTSRHPLTAASRISVCRSVCMCVCVSVCVYMSIITHEICWLIASFVRVQHQQQQHHTIATADRGEWRQLIDRGRSLLVAIALCRPLKCRLVRWAVTPRDGTTWPTKITNV